MSSSPLLIEDTNLSEAWYRTLKHIFNNRGKEISPLLLSITNFDETSELKQILNAHLKAHKKASIETVSETIFPESLYQYLKRNRFDLYKEYRENLSRLKAIDKSNRHGTYFERLIAYEGSKTTVNQLELIILSLKQNKVKRRSKLQASIFDPEKDHTTGMFQGFPCLQHVTFYKTDKGGLVINGFYALQFLYRRGYGNWLGLINLGKFIANEAGLELERFNCYIGVEFLDELKKEDAKNLMKSMEKYVSN